jgi:LuxR family transcriptional regulator, maltose regulon positive regulatory protein
MSDGTASQSPAIGRRVIRRPRLTRLLDGADVPLLLLVAPAGFGKTTLVRQWLVESDRRAVWHDLTPAAADVAELATSIVRLAGDLLPGAAALLVDRVRAAGNTEMDASALADALTANAAAWPKDAWLVLDDYHNVMDAPEAEEFVSRLTAVVRTVIISRRRPSWITARKLLYGEARELGPNTLAMTDAEAADVLQLPNEEAAFALVSLAAGWPAVIALAALTPQSLDTLDDELPGTLHDYFAEELYQSFPESLRSSLCALSVAPTITTDIVNLLAGAEATELIMHAETHGFLNPSAGGGMAIHPLLRQFLRSKLALGTDDTETWIDNLVDHLSAHRHWDEAFSVIEETQRPDLFGRLLEEALHPMLREGRVATVRRWLTAALAMGPTSPPMDLALAEVAFREGRHLDAQMHALDAASGLSADNPHHSRALYRAAQSAQLADRAEDALSLHQQAALTATNSTDERQAIWGQFITHTELGHREAALDAILRFEQSRPTATEDKLRQAQAHLSSAIRWGGVKEALEKWRHRLDLVEGPCDPLVKTGFLQMLGTALGLAAAYGDALKVAELEREEAERVGLDFVLPHALCMRANAQNGLRRYREAGKTIREILDSATGLRDNHSAANARAIQAKMLLAQGKVVDAVEALASEPPDWPNRVMKAEFLAMRALTAACADHPEEALTLAKDSAAVSDQVEADLPARWAIAIAQLRITGKTDAICATFDRSKETGHLDSVVATYRAHPPVLVALADDPLRANSIRTLVDAVGDYSLAQRFKVPIRPTRSRTTTTLTKRERDVATLLCQGFSNAEIAKALWIEQSTAKVHVQHILRKLGARSRTEAALRAAEEGLLEGD